MRSPQVWVPTSRFRVGWLVAATVVILALGGCSGSEGSDSDDDVSQTDGAPGSSSGDGASMLQVELGARATFTMPEGESEAVASFEVPAGTIVTITAEGSDTNRGEFALEIRPPDSQASILQVSAGAEPVERRFVTSAESGTCWGITARGTPGETVSLTVNAVPQDDASSGSDAAGDASNPTPIDGGVPYHGLLEGADIGDWYVMVISGGEIVSIRLDMLEDAGVGSMDASLQFNGQSVVSASVFPGEEEAVTHIFAADQTGDLYLKIVGSGSYGFEIAIVGQDDGGSGGDAAPDEGSATPALFGTISGVLGGDDGADVYALVLPADAVVLIEASQPVGESGGVSVGLTYNGGSVANLSISPGETESTSVVMLNVADEVGYLTVTGLGTYKIVITAAIQSDGGDGTGDAGGEATLAKTIDSEGSFEGWLGGNDGRDFYSFTPTESGPIDIGIVLDADFAGSTRVIVKAEIGPSIVEFTVDAGGVGNQVAEFEAGQIYFLEVQTPHELHYTLTLAPG